MKAGNLLTAILVVLVATAAGQVQAQEEQRGPLLSLIELTIQPTQAREFRDGVRAWRDCYLENEGEMEWSVWHRVQGKGPAFTAAFPVAGWAEFGAQDPAGEACQEIVDEQINPHVAESTHLVARELPQMSQPIDDFEVVEVHNFKVADHGAFFRVVNQVIEVLRADEDSNPGVWYDVEGGRDAPDYFVVAQFADFAALDDRQRNVWATVERHRGEEETARLREEFSDAISDYWSYIYRRVDELSRVGTE